MCKTPCGSFVPLATPLDDTTDIAGFDKVSDMRRLRVTPDLQAWHKECLGSQSGECDLFGLDELFEALFDRREFASVGGLGVGGERESDPGDSFRYGADAYIQRGRNI